MPLLPADFTHARPCKPFCEKFLTLPEIMAAMRSLRQMPQRFPYFEELYITPNKYHKMFVEKWYLVLYQIQDDTVYVDYILDCRKDYSWLIK